MDISEEWEKLRPALGDMISRIDSRIRFIEAEEKRFQEKQDESYLRGLNDMAQAVIAFTGPIEKGCMSKEDMLNYVGCTNVSDALNLVRPKEFIEKCNKWKADKEVEEKIDQEELHVGDEIEYSFPGREPEKCIIIGLENGIADEKIIWTIGLDLSQRSWFSSVGYYGDSYRKTGKHYDAIPFPEKILEDKNVST